MTRKRKAPSSHQTEEHKKELVVVSESEDSSDEDSEEKEQPKEEDGEKEDTGEPKDEASKRKLVRELLDPLSKQQIIDLLKHAAEQDPQLKSTIARIAETDPTYRRIFVHGLSSETTAKDLVEAFKPFGEIEEHNLVKDKRSGRSKRYAFVTYKTRSGAEKALKEPQKKIGDKTVSCNLAALGKSNSNVADGNRKIYIGNVGPNVTCNALKAFFERYGEIEDGGPGGFDFTTNSFSKGFAVVAFKTVEGYEKAMEEPVKVLDNCQLYCKKFVEKSNDSSDITAALGNSNELAQSNTVVSGVVNNNGLMSANADLNAYSSTAFGNHGHLGMNNASAILNLAGLLNAGIGFQPSNAPLLAGGYPSYNPSPPLMGQGFNVPFGNFGINPGLGSSVMANYGPQVASQNVQMQGQLPTGTEAVDFDGSEASSSLGMPSFLNC